MDEINFQKLKEIYGVLSNENRLKIIFYCSKEHLTITELSKKLKLNYNMTSQYVSSLSKLELIKKTRKPNKTVIVESLIIINKLGEIKKKEINY